MVRNDQLTKKANVFFVLYRVSNLDDVRLLDHYIEDAVASLTT